MSNLSFAFAAEGFEPLAVEDMGEEVVILSQRNERGKVERVAISRGQAIAALEAVAGRYCYAKNTERLTEAA